MANVRPENLKRFHVPSERRDQTAFLDEQGHSRVILNGRVQPVRYSHLAPISLTPQNLQWEQMGEYIDMNLPENRERFPELITLRKVAG